MNEYELNKEIERVKHARRLGGFDKTCVVCGEPDARCLELHHLAGRGYGPEKVPICRNDHRKVTDRSDNEPPPEFPSTLDRIGHWLLGLAELFLLLASSALAFGQTLIEAAKVSPQPYGYALEVNP